MGLRAVLSNLALLRNVLEIISLIFETTFDVLGQFGGLAKRPDNVLHVVSLATDQAAKVQDNTLGLIPLTKYGHVSVL